MNPIKKVLAFLNEKNVIMKNTKQNHNIIFGGRSIYKQVSGRYARPNSSSSDFDILSKVPRKSASQIEKKLDKQSGGDNYYIAPSKFHRGTFKVYSREHTYNRGVADITRQTKKIKTVKINNVKYADLSFDLKNKQKALTDKNHSWRHKKDAYDVKTIQIYNQMKNNKFLRNFLSR